MDLSEILGLYKEDARRYVQQMRTDVQAWDQVAGGGPASLELRKLAHQLRGSGRTYGFRKVTRIGKALEHVMIILQAKRFPADDRARHLITKYIDRLEVIFES